LDSKTKNPVLVEAGRRGARRRWGEPRIVKLADLDPDTARLIRALLAQRPPEDAPTPEAA
jgi:hypothetical protein